MILQLNPPLWLDTSKGQALAHFVIDQGLEHELEFVCFHDNGEIWSWSQRDVRAAQNITLGRKRANGIGNASRTQASRIAVVEGSKD